MIDGDAGNDILTGNGGADSMTGGTGGDTFNVALGMSVAATAVIGLTAGNIATDSTIVFADGVDVITDFGTGTDVMSGLYPAALPATLVGESATDLSAAAAYQFRGDYNSTTGEFVGSAGGTDTLVVFGGAGIQDNLNTNTSMIVLEGVTSVTAADFVA